jgi:hypothetical protein
MLPALSQNGQMTVQSYFHCLYRLQHFQLDTTAHQVQDQGAPVRLPAEYLSALMPIEQRTKNNLLNNKFLKARQTFKENF